MYNKKLIGFFLIALILAVCIGTASAGENTTLTSVNEEKTLNDIDTDISNDNILSENEEKMDLNATIVMQEEIPHSMSLHIQPVDARVYYPEDYNESINVYIDGEYYGSTQSHTIGIYGFEYEFGEHILKVNFPESAIYKGQNITKKFSIVETRLSIMNSSDEIHVSAVTAADVEGIIKIIVNDTTLKTVDLKNYFDHNPTYQGVGFYTSLYDLAPGTYKVTVIYSGDSKYKKAEKSAIVTKGYSITADDSLEYYGEKIFRIQLPQDIKSKKLDVTIDGKKYSAKYDDYEFCVDVSDLSLGSHEYIITYQGDDKYPKKTIMGELKLYTSFRYSALMIYGENTTVSLKIPTNESGNLSVLISKGYLNGIDKPLPEASNSELFYATSPLINGEASIDIKGLNVGEYNFLIKYDGATKIKEVNTIFTVFPKIIAPKEMTYGQKTTIYAVADENANGVVELTGMDNDDIEYYLTIRMVNGSGNCTFNKLPIQKYSFESEYRNDTTNIYGKIIPITVKGLKPVITQNRDVTMFYNDGSTYSFKLKDEYGRYSNSRITTIKIGSKTSKVESEDGIVKFKINEVPGSYKITATYKGTTVTNKIVVKHVVTLKTVKVKRSGKKLTLTATLKNKKVIKNKQVTFKFNGKTYKAKTNSKGIAKVTISSKILKNLKAGKTVSYQATYLKDTIKKTAKVQK